MLDFSYSSEFNQINRILVVPRGFVGFLTCIEIEQEHLFYFKTAQYPLI